ncbi:hypothetical protein KKF91_01335 [Myxococcota bacterium]|nr:hypothetical protein [Myxococcota bacterium]MBU1429179.1 hypothetical protein [Myxococcota bacterium]MBU1896754.1 hypothetical protein [Myxococcota bacterium]
MDILEQINQTAFLSAEFLTWLWFRSEHSEGEFEVDPEFGPFEVWFEDKLTVGSAAINAQENLFKGGHPSTSLEARTALRLGKLAHNAKLRIVKGAQEWSFALKAPDLSISGVKLPAVLSREEDDRFYERMYLLEQLDGMIKGLFTLFLKIRLSPKWSSQELPAIQAWVSGQEDPPAPAKLPQAHLPELKAPIKRRALGDEDRPLKARAAQEAAQEATAQEATAQEADEEAAEEAAQPMRLTDLTGGS